MTLSHVKVKKTYIELSNLFVLFKRIGKYFWTSKFILAFIIIFVLFPLVFVGAKHFITTKKVKKTMNERNKMEDSLHLQVNVS